MKRLTYFLIGVVIFGIPMSTMALGNETSRSRWNFFCGMQAKNDTLPDYVGSMRDSIRLQKNNNTIVPLGYGITRSQNELTSAVDIATAKDLSANKVKVNAGNAFYGLLPGLMSLKVGANAPPPARTNFFIRGVDTYTNKSPLILVDGFQRPLQSSNEVAGLSLEEIQSVSVLKDAASLAMYGQRGANGVILITTKRGGNHDLQVNASYDQGITQPRNIPSFVNGPTYARAINEALENDGNNPRYSDEDLAAFDSGNYPYLYPDVNWADQVLRKSGTRNNLNINVNGQADRIRYYLMGNLVGSNGFFGPTEKNDDYSTQVKYLRFNFRSNLDIEMTDKLLLKANISGAIVEHNIPMHGGGTANILGSIYSVPSAAYPVRNFDGSFGGSQDFAQNPVAVLTSTGYGQPNTRQFSVVTSLQRDMNDVVKGLSAKATVRYYIAGNFFEHHSKSFSYKEVRPERNDAGELTDTTITQLGSNTNLSFGSSFGNEQHYIDELGKVNYKKNWSNTRLRATLFFHQSSIIRNGQDNVFHRQNYVGNVHVGISQKYFMDVSASYNGNNLLEPGHRFGFFPAVSAGWLISNENFLKKSSVLNRLKLRASWGLTGSDNVPHGHIYKKTYSGAGGYRFGRYRGFQGGFAEDAYPTDDFTYETSEKINVGIEATLLNRLTFKGDAFYEHRTNILAGRGGSISGVLGVSAGQETDGIVDNKGFETSLTWQDKIGEVGYTIGGNLLFTHNEIVNENEQYRPEDYLKRTGRQVGQHFGLQAIGFYKDQQDIANSPAQNFSTVKPGDVKYKDQNNDGVINNFDEVSLGHSSGYPEVYYSFNVGLHYKGFGASALFQGAANYTAYLNARNIFWPLYGSNNISNHYYNHRWTPQTANSATLPRLTSESNDNDFRANSIWLVNRNYMKLRTAELYYSFPSSVVNSLNITNLKLYLRGYNLFSIDSVPVVDPEELGGGYPLMRTYSIGLKMRF